MFVLLVFCCCRTALGAQTLTATSEAVSDTSMIRALVDGFWAENAEVAHLPGLVLVVVEDGRVLFADGYGFADLDRGVPKVVSVLNLAFFLAFGVWMMRADFLLFFKSVPLGLKLIMSLPWLSGLLTVGLLPLAWHTWRSTQFHLVWKAHYVAVTLASVSFVWYVSYWNVVVGW